MEEKDKEETTKRKGEAIEKYKDVVRGRKKGGSEERRTRGV